MKIIVIGIGLIGGSMARDLGQQLPDAHMLGMDANPGHLQEAISLGIVQGEATAEDLAGADVVILSIPVDQMVNELPKLLDAVGDDTLVLDAGSTKEQICAAVAQHPKRRNFLACHPISGTEFSGPKAALIGLFNGKANIICEVEKTAFRLQERALELFALMGMRIRYMDPVAHDRHIAYVSHLSHISAFMLGKTVIEKEKDERDIFDMAGSGFESTVRLAKSSPAMWTPIFLQNKENVLKTLDSYIQNLQNFKDKIAAGDGEALYTEMENTNRIKEILNGIPLTKNHK